MFTNRVAVAALAIVVVVAAGGLALSRLTGPGTGGPSPTPIPSLIPSPIPSLIPSPSAPPATITTASVGETLEAGTYRVEEFAAPFSVTLPAGWTANEFTFNSIALANATDGTQNIYVVVVDKVYLDPCHTDDGPTDIGPGVNDLVAAFSSMPDFDVGNLRDATVGGAPGKAFRFSNAIDVAAAGCSGDVLPFGTYDNDGEDIDIAMFGNESDRFWVVNAAGTRVLIAITKVPSIVQATQEVLDSISFDSGSSN
jgi:hypothetical protein